MLEGEIYYKLLCIWMCIKLQFFVVGWLLHMWACGSEMLVRITRNCEWWWFNTWIFLYQQSKGCWFKPLKDDSCARELSPISLFCPWAMYFLLQGDCTCSKHTDVIWIRKHLPKPSFGGRVLGFNPKVIFQNLEGLIHEPESCWDSLSPFCPWARPDRGLKWDRPWGKCTVRCFGFKTAFEF